MFEQQRAPDRVTVGAERRQGLVEHRPCAVERSGGVRRLGREPADLDDVQAGLLAGVGHLRPQGERALEVPLGLRRRERRRCLATRRDRCAERTAQVVRRVPVVGEHRGRLEPRPGELGRRVERLSVGGVQAHALARQQVLVQGVARQRVPERVAASASVHHQQLLLDRLAQRGVEPLLVERGDRRDELVGRPASCRRDHPQHVSRVVGEVLGAREQHVVQGRRQSIRVGAGEHRAGDLLDEERVAVGALEHAVDQLGLGRLRQDALELDGDLVARQPLELEPANAARAVPAADEAAQGMRPLQLVGAIGEDEQYLGVVQAAHEQRHQLERRVVGPVEVLEGHDERPVAPGAADGAEHELEQLRRLRALVAECRRRAVRVELRHQPRQLGPRAAEQLVERVGRDLMGERAQRLGQRRERHRVAAELDAPAGDHPAAGRARRRPGLLDEPCLADARLAADDHDRRLALPCLCKRVGDRLEVAVPPDEDRTDDSCHRGHLHRESRRGPIRYSPLHRLPGDAEPRPGAPRRQARPPRAHRGRGRAHERELSKVLDHIEKIGELGDLADVEPTSHVIAVENALRADEPRPSLPRRGRARERARRATGGFRVPSPGPAPA